MNNKRTALECATEILKNSNDLTIDKVIETARLFEKYLDEEKSLESKLKRISHKNKRR